MFSDSITTVCTTYDQLVTGGAVDTEEATSMPTNVVTTTVASTEPESIPVITSQGTGSVIITTAAATYCSDCTCQQGM